MTTNKRRTRRRRHRKDKIEKIEKKASRSRRHKRRHRKTIINNYSYESDIVSSETNKLINKETEINIVHGLKDFLQGKK